MFLGCSPCCATCIEYTLSALPFQGYDEYDVNPIMNVYLDLTFRASAGAFTSSIGVPHPSMDTGLISGAGWLFPYGTSTLGAALSDIPAYDFTHGKTRFAGTLNFLPFIVTGFPIPYAASQSVGMIGFDLGSEMQIVEGASSVPSSFPPHNLLVFSPCEIYWRGDETGASSSPADTLARQPLGRRFGTFDLIAETLSTRSRTLSGIPTPFYDATTDFTLSAGSVAIDETLQDTNNWVTDYLGNPIVCHRFSGSSNKSLSVMDGTAPLEATWTWNDITHDGVTFCNSFLELTVREFLLYFSDGTVQNALPWWTASLTTFSS